MRMRSTYEVLTTQILLLLTLVVLPEIPYAQAHSDSKSNPIDFCVQFLILSTPLLFPFALLCFIKLLCIAANILNNIRFACFRFQLARQLHNNSRQHHHHHPPHANLSTAQDRGTLDHHHHHHHDANLGPILVFSEVKRLNVAAGAELVCPICLSSLHDQDVLHLLTKCGHAFHPHCIDTWLQNHSTCPLCRANVLADCDVAATSLILPVDDHTDEQQQQRQDLVMETQSSSEVVLELNTRFNPFLPRSNSTGHSLMNDAGDNTVEMRIQILNPELHRSTSFDVVVSCQY